MYTCIFFFLQLKARPEVYVPPEANQPLTAPDSAPSNNQAPESQKTILQQNLHGKATYKLGQNTEETWHSYSKMLVPTM